MTRSESRIYWSELLAEADSCGKSLSAFSRERRLSYASLQYWRRKLRRAPVSGSDSFSSGFLELLPAAGYSGNVSGSGVSVELPCGVRLALARDFDGLVLARAVAALSGATR